MSGIVGIVNLDGAPVDPGLLRDMTQHMAYRGPDAQQTWTDAHVGFGHAMLRTTFEMAKESQPSSVDGHVWITADARIDARNELIHKLESKTSRKLANATDADLILHAYQAWDKNCVDHLCGDFAFAIWDVPRQRLFCARDHFGIRQFHYAQVGGCLVFSNNLSTIRLHPRVSDKLNDLAIVNYLLFRYQPRIDQTSFADVQTLLPAHTLVWEAGRTKISRYWTLPIEDPIRYRRHEDYVDRFRELFDAAVATRMRTDRAGILMSGGLDSPSIAATIHSIGNQQKSRLSLRAFTYVYDRQIPDQERRNASLVADYFAMPIHFAVLDDEKWFGGWDRASFRFPEPMVNGPLWNEDDFIRRAAQSDDIRVFYSGWGPDTMLNLEPTHYPTLLRHGRIGELVKQIGTFILRYRRRPPLFLRSAIRRWWQRQQGPASNDSRFEPEALKLLARDLAEHVDIPKQWWQFPDKPQTHPWRPAAYSKLTNYYWTLCFQSNDAANWHAPVEFRYPYFDVSLVRYLLRVPVLPWCSNKALLREAMRGKLPELIRLRPKTPVPGEPIHRYADWVHRNTTPAAQLKRYVDIGRLDELFAGLATSSPADALVQRVVAINHWLHANEE
jgi:asparagine synthase (glutamine-hydrolysing)